MRSGAITSSSSSGVSHYTQEFGSGIWICASACPRDTIVSGEEASGRTDAPKYVFRTCVR
jgi:Fe-S-cluster-containing hydrogenase component 2